jgi:replicative DNA helicase
LTAPVDDIDEHVTLLQEKSKRRRLVALELDLRRAIAGGEDPDGVAEVIRGRLQQFDTPAVVRPSAPLPLAADAALVEWERPLPPALPTGLDAIDAIIGGLRAESSYYLNAATGKGKTGLALQIAAHISHSVPVVYISSELSRRQLLARVAAQHLSASWLELYNLPPDMAGAIAEAVRAGAPMLRVIKLDANTSLTDLLKREADAIGVAPLAVLDYLQHAARRSTPTDYRIAMSVMSDEIARFTTDARSSALVVSSVARGFYNGNEEKSASDFLGSAKDSGDIEFDAAGVMFLDCEPCPPGGTSSARLHVAKHRFGGVGTVGLTFDGRVGRFTHDPAHALTDEQEEVYQTIKSGASSVEEVAQSIKRRDNTVREIVKVLVGRGLVGQRPLRVLR